MLYPVLDGRYTQCNTNDKALQNPKKAIPSRQRDPQAVDRNGGTGKLDSATSGILN